MKIDIVYLWVNGADPIWQGKRAKAQQRLNPHSLAQYGNVAGRYRDNGELRYNLRALERFFPDHGHVFIVTDAQRPEWLAEHPNITLIDHADLIPASARPVFDAGHIESYLHHIPNLSERFIYLNDDIFFGAPVKQADWFGEDGLTVHFENTPTPTHQHIVPSETALVNAAIISKNWLSTQFEDYQHREQLCAHAPRPMLKSALWELEREAHELFQAVRSTTFRTWSIPPVMSDLALRWMMQQGAQAIQSEALYISSGEPTALEQFAALKSQFGHLPYFCINDTCDDCPDDDPRLFAVERTLAALLPKPSAYEMANAEIFALA